ncbi:MAG: 50S ribosomal protein L17 [Planctomycetes bacterium]|nr:50S ribosomal protein L17 [Planctomycetota bacterium]
MRHKVKGRRLSRTSSHRVALRRNLAASLFTHGRIVTTMPKAKEIKPFAEKLITLARKAVSKRDTDKPAYVHYYRMILSRLQDKELTRKLVGEGKWRESGGIAQRYLTRNGGYTRIIRLSGSRLGVLTGGKVGKIPELEYKIEGVDRKLRLIGNRLGDNANRVIFELVEGVGEEPKSEEVEVKPEAPKAEPKKPRGKKPQAAKAKEAESAQAEEKKAKEKETVKPSDRPPAAAKAAKPAGAGAGEKTAEEGQKTQEDKKTQAKQEAKEEKEQEEQKEEG